MFCEMNRSRAAAAMVMCVVLAMGMFTGCMGTDVNFELSPKLIEMETEAVIEDDQLYVLADLIFNLPVKSDEDGPGELSVNLGDRRVSSSDITVLNGLAGATDMVYDFKDIAEDQVLHLKIRTDSVENGILKITAKEKLTRFSHITDPTGAYSIKLFSVNKCIGSGAEIQMNSTESQNISLTVKEPANRCDVMLIKLRDDDADSTIEPDAGTYDKLVDKCLIVRNEDYRLASQASTAADIAETVNKCYGSLVIAEAVGTKVTMRTRSKSDTHHYSLVVYEY